MAVWKWISELYHTLLESGDPQTNQWPLMQSPLLTLYFTAAYIMVTVAGSVFIELKSPVSVQPWVVSFSVAKALACSYLAKEFLMSAYLSNYSFICEPVHSTDEPLALRMATAFWFFYLIRLSLFLDTVFILLQKKPQQVTLFHVFHHSSAPIASWIMVKYAPGGQAFLHGILDATVGAMRCCYRTAYCYSSTKKYAVAFRKYVYLANMIELFTVVCHSLVGALVGCFSPNWFLMVMASYCVVNVLVLTVFNHVTFLDLLHIFGQSGYTALGLTQLEKHYPPKVPSEI